MPFCQTLWCTKFRTFIITFFLIKIKQIYSSCLHVYFQSFPAVTETMEFASISNTDIFNDQKGENYLLHNNEIPTLPLGQCQGILG